MRKVTIHVAKTQLSRLIEAALAGEEVMISKGDKPVVRLVAIPQGQFKLGVLEPDALRAGPDFFPRWTRTNWRTGKGAPDDAPARHPCLGMVSDRRPADFAPRPREDGRSADNPHQRDFVLRSRAESAPRQMAGNGALRLGTRSTASSPRRRFASGSRSSRPTRSSIASLCGFGEALSERPRRE
jgi:antitoxin (DNA-binding transcriptional repressor) of toxin-antitoxin stability system